MNQRGQRKIGTVLFLENFFAWKSLAAKAVLIQPILGLQ